MELPLRGAAMLARADFDDLGRGRDARCHLGPSVESVYLGICVVPPTMRGRSRYDLREGEKLRGAFDTHIVPPDLGELPSLRRRRVYPPAGAPCSMILQA